MEQLYIGIDMGGTKCAVVAGHADGKILRRIAFPSGKDAHPDEFLPRFYEAIDALLREYNGGAAPADKDSVNDALGVDFKLSLIHI